MAASPPWGFSDLDDVTRWAATVGLASERRPPDQPLDDIWWQRVINECDVHGLTGFLIQAALDGTFPVTSTQRAELAQLEMNAAKRRTGYDARITITLGHFDDAGIEVRVLKGTSLPYIDYPDPQLRPTTDLDILVKGDEIERAAQLLVGLGGELVNPEPTAGWTEHVFKGLTVSMPDGFEVDLHRVLNWGAFGVRVPQDDLWVARRPVIVAGVERFTLGLEETLVHMCAHLLVLGAYRLREVRDVAQLLTNPELDAARTLTIARRWRHEPLLATGIAMARSELAMTDEPGALGDWAARYRVGKLDRLWMRVESPVDPIGGIEQLAVFVSLGRGPARRILLRGNLAPIPGTQASPLDRVAAVVHRVRRRIARH